MIKSFIFDIGNVLVDFDPVPFFDHRCKDEQMREVCALVIDKDWEKMDEGVYTCEEVRQIKLAKYPQYHKQIHYIFDHWMDMMKEKEDSIAYMKELKSQGYGIYILSNIGIESHTYLKNKYTFFDLVDGMILSYEHHLIKPDEQIYHLLLETFHLQGEQCVFFDDRIQNIKSAQEVGIHAIQFHSVTQAKKKVAIYVDN